MARARGTKKFGFSLMNFSGSLGIRTDLRNLLLNYDFDTLVPRGHLNRAPSAEIGPHPAAFGSARQLRHDRAFAADRLAGPGLRAGPAAGHRTALPGRVAGHPLRRGPRGDPAHQRALRHRRGAAALAGPPRPRLRRVPENPRPRAGRRAHVGGPGQPGALLHRRHNHARRAAVDGALRDHFLRSAFQCRDCGRSLLPAYPRPPRPRG